MRMMENTGWGAPAVKLMERYSEFVVEGLREGLGQTQRLENVAEAISASRNGMSIAQKARLNMTANASLLALGNKHSWRRMVLGGVDDDMVEAAGEFYRLHSTTVMREVSATQNGPFDPGWDRSNTKVIDEVQPDGSTRKVEYVTVKSQFRRIAAGDPLRTHALQQQMHRPLDDPMTRQAVMPIATLIRPQTADWVIDEIPELIRLNDMITDSRARAILAEFMGAPSRDSLDAMIHGLDRSGVGLGPALRDALPSNGDVSFDRVLHEVRKWADETGTPWAHTIASQLEHAKKIVAHLDGKELATRRWTGQFLRGNVGDGRVTVADFDGAGRDIPVFVDRNELEIELAMTNIEYHRVRDDFMSSPDGDDAASLDVLDFWTDLGRPRAIDDLSEDLIIKYRDIARQRQSNWENTASPTGFTRGSALEFKGFADRMDDILAYRTEQLTGIASTTIKGPPGVFYDNFAAAEQDMARALSGRARNAHHQEQMSRTQREAGVGTVSGQVQLYEVNRLDGPYSDAPAPDFDDLLAASTNPRLLRRNKALVEELVGSPSATLVSDPELAVALNDAYFKFTGVREGFPRTDLRSIAMDRAAVDGRFHGDGALNPRYKADLGRGESQVQAWDIDWSTIPEGRLDYVDRQQLAAADDWAEVAVGRLRQVWTRGSHEAITPRMRILDDGTEESVLWEAGAAGQKRALTKGERIDNRNPNVKYQDRKGKTVDFGDSRYFDRLEASVDEAADPIWEALGPMFEDAWDELQGVSHFVPKQVQGLRPHEIGNVHEFVPVFRSQEQHFENAAGLPNFAISEMLATAPKGKWNEFVRRGFDEVIGPSIDALARRPMAFHFFAQRYSEAKHAASWLRDPAIVRSIDDMITRVVAKGGDVKDARWMAETSRRVAGAEGVQHAEKMTDGQALAWLRGHRNDEIAKMLKRVEGMGGEVGDRARRLAQRPFDEIKGTVDPDLDFDGFLTYVRAHTPEGALDDAKALDKDAVRQAFRKDPVLQRLDEGDWEKLVAAERNRKHIHDAAGEFAAVSAIGDMMPFIDSHELRTQWAEFGKGFLPFWYAEENFMKRWARTVALDPTSIRKAQLGYMGLKQAGVIRTDESGKDWMVFPGSTAIQETLSKVLPIEAVAGVGVLFQAPTDMLLPGVNSRVGTPQFSPLVSLPVDWAVAMFPELAPVERGLLGDFGASRSMMQQITPAIVTNTFQAIFADEGTARYLSAMTSAMAQLEATGKGPPDNATPGQIDEFLDRLREHARIILASQAMMGFFAPGPPSQLTTGGNHSLFGLNAVDPSQVLSETYLTLIRSFGIEQGTIRYLDLYPNAHVNDIVNPMAFTVAQPYSKSGAYLPATEAAVEFLESNSNYFQAYPMASPWLLPQPAAGEDTSNQYASQQYVNYRLREKRNPDEFFKMMKYKQAAGPYFTASDKHDADVAAARANKDDALVKRLNDNWATASAIYKSQHPIFADMLVNGDSEDPPQERHRRDADRRQGPRRPQVRPLRDAQEDGPRLRRVQREPHDHVRRPLPGRQGPP